MEAVVAWRFSQFSMEKDQKMGIFWSPNEQILACGYDDRRLPEAGGSTHQFCLLSISKRHSTHRIGSLSIGKFCHVQLSLFGRRFIFHKLLGGTPPALPAQLMAIARGNHRLSVSKFGQFSGLNTLITPLYFPLMILPPPLTIWLLLSFCNLCLTGLRGEWGDYSLHLWSRNEPEETGSATTIKKTLPNLKVTAINF